MGTPLGERPDGPDVVVAGHVCLDVIPEWPTRASHLDFRPGMLANVGPVVIAPGGCVSNAGLALHRLGARVRLLGKVGDDPFGELVRGALEERGAGLASGLLVEPSGRTSYSLILSPPDRDRMIFHFPGANDTFVADDIPADSLRGARLFHFGYPPIMRAMYEDGGRQLARVLSTARAAGLGTSLDMAYPDPDAPAGGVDWPGLLSVALPEVDIFLPSLEEALVTLRPDHAAGLADGDDGGPSAVSAELVSSLGQQILEMGAAAAVVKLGARGLYLRSAGMARLRQTGLPALAAEGWADRELWSNVFPARVVGTTGSGDATVAGFLFAVLAAMSPEAAVTAACAVGGSSVEAPDATSGVRSWKETEGRIAGGWQRTAERPGPEWRPAGEPGLWRGPSDRAQSARRARTG